MGGYVKADPWTLDEVDLTDANYTDLIVSEIPTNETLELKAFVTVFLTADGSLAGGWEINSTFKNIAGTVTQLDPDEVNVYRLRPSSAYDVRFLVSGTTAKLQIKGANGIHVKARVGRMS